jgi:hypothetical protein
VPYAIAERAFNFDKEVLTPFTYQVQSCKRFKAIEY